MEQKKVDLIANIRDTALGSIEKAQGKIDKQAISIMLLGLSTIAGVCGGYLQGLEDAKSDSRI